MDCRYVFIEFHTVSHRCPRLCTADFCLRCPSTPSTRRHKFCALSREDCLLYTRHQILCVCRCLLARNKKTSCTLLCVTSETGSAVTNYTSCCNSYSPEPNPGPSTNHSSSPANSQSRSLSQTHSSWICGTCDLAVHWNDRGLVCDQCGQWFHGQCQSVDTINYGLLSDSSTQ